MRSLLCVGLSCLSLAVWALPARAMMIAPAPIPQRVATADAVVVGKVTGFADRTVSALPYPGAREKVEYQVALVKVQTDILGARGAKEVRVAFVPPAPPPPPPRPGQPVLFRRPNRQPTLTLNQEACLFLTKHHSEDFYLLPAYFDVINKQGNPAFGKEVELATRSAKLLADPRAGLESGDKGDRLLTAGMLISRYRTPRPAAGQPKTEPIDAEQSKRILHVLADADWNPRPGPGQAFQMTPQNLFFRLGLTPRDGWNQPKDFREVPEVARKWLKEHADTYRIQRYVTEKGEK